MRKIILILFLYIYTYYYIHTTHRFTPLICSLQDPTGK